MIYIGVTGKSGAGKTSFSNFWEEKSNVGVIHYDELVDNAKLKYFRLFMERNYKNKPIKVRSGLKKNIYKNRFAFRFLMFIRDRVTSKELNQKILEFKRRGKDIIVIDDWMLNTHKDLLAKCNRIYVITRNSIDRRNGLMEREKLSLQEANCIDIPFALKYAKMPDGDNVRIVRNNGTLDELQKMMEQEYLELGVLGFDEKYQIHDNGVKDKLRQISRGATSIDNMLRNIGSKSLEESSD